MVLFPGYIGGERVEIGILEAAASGNVSIIRRWLDDGGDANEEITAGPCLRADVSAQDARRLATGSAGPPRPARPSRVPVLAGETAAPSESPCRRRHALERVVSSRYEYARLIPPTLRAAANSPKPPKKNRRRSTTISRRTKCAEGRPAATTGGGQPYVQSSGLGVVLAEGLARHAVGPREGLHLLPEGVDAGVAVQ